MKKYIQLQNNNALIVSSGLLKFENMDLEFYWDIKKWGIGIEFISNHLSWLCMYWEMS